MIQFLRMVFSVVFGSRHALAEPEVYVNPLRLACEGKKEDPPYLVAARARSIAALGSRYVLSPAYKCRAVTYEAFLKQPPFVLNAWADQRAENRRIKSAPQRKILTLRKP